MPVAEGSPRRLLNADRIGGGTLRLSPWLAVALPTILAALLAAIGLGSRSLWLDEGASVAIASQHGSALWHAIGHDGGNMLLFYLLLHVVIGVFGSGEVALRLPSLIAAAAIAGLTGALGLKLLVRPMVALAAGVLCAVSLPLVFWGQDARGYAMMAAFSAASWLALLAVLDGPSGRPASRGALAAYAISTLLALYVGFDAALVIPAQLLAVLGAPARERLRAVILTLLLVAVACVPLVVLAVQRGSNQLFWVPGLRGSVLGQAAIALLSAGYSPNFHHTATTTVTAVITALVILAGTGLALRASGPRAWLQRLPVAWLALPAVLALAGAAAGEPLELARIAVLLLPAVALLLALPLAAVPSRWRPGPRGWPLLLALGLSGLLALRAVQLAPSYGVSPEDWHAATAYVLSESRRGACLAFYPQDGRMPFDYYARGRPAAAPLDPVLPAMPLSQVRPFVERYTIPSRHQIARIEARCPRLWVIASHQGQRTGPPASQANLRRYRGLLRLLRRGYRHRVARSFGYAAAVHVTRLSR